MLCILFSDFHLIHDYINVVTLCRTVNHHALSTNTTNVRKAYVLGTINAL